MKLQIWGWSHSKAVCPKPVAGMLEWMTPPSFVLCVMYSDSHSKPEPSDWPSLCQVAASRLRHDWSGYLISPHTGIYPLERGCFPENKWRCWEGKRETRRPTNEVPTHWTEKAGARGMGHISIRDTVPPVLPVLLQGWIALPGKHLPPVGAPVIWELWVFLLVSSLWTPWLSSLCVLWHLPQLSSYRERF